jgi:hypothetical protein
MLLSSGNTKQLLVYHDGMTMTTMVSFSCLLSPAGEETFPTIRAKYCKCLRAHEKARHVITGTVVQQARAH